MKHSLLDLWVYESYVIQPLLIWLLPPPHPLPHNAMFDLHTASLKVLEYEKLWYVFFLLIIGDRPILFFRYLDVLHYIDGKVGFLKSCIGALSGVFLCTGGYKVWWMSVTDTHRKSNVEPSNTCTV